jgi:biotin operon repressor
LLTTAYYIYIVLLYSCVEAIREAMESSTLDGILLKAGIVLVLNNSQDLSVNELSESLSASEQEINDSVDTLMKLGVTEKLPNGRIRKQRRTLLEDRLKSIAKM